MTSDNRTLNLPIPRSSLRQKNASLSLSFTIYLLYLRLSLTLLEPNVVPSIPKSLWSSIFLLYLHLSLPPSTYTTYFTYVSLSLLHIGILESNVVPSYLPMWNTLSRHKYYRHTFFASQPISLSLSLFLSLSLLQTLNLVSHISRYTHSKN